MMLGGVFIAIMAVGLYSLQVKTAVTTIETQSASAITATGLEVVRDTDTLTPAKNSNNTNKATTMKIDDIKIGTGATASNGDSVAVHYVGRLADGSEFDNSHKRGAPIEFTIGAGQVIAGWEEGIAGMQVGGERTLVIPPEKAYGDRGIGPIPGGATLTFTVELMSIN